MASEAYLSPFFPCSIMLYFDVELNKRTRGCLFMYLSVNISNIKRLSQLLIS